MSETSFRFMRDRRRMMVGAASLALCGAAAAFGCSSSDSAAQAVVEAGADAPDVADAGESCLPRVPVDTEAYDPACPVKTPEKPDSFDEVLKVAGLDRCTLGYTEKDYSAFPTELSADPWRMPWFDTIHNHAVRAPSYAKALVNQLDTGAASRTPVSYALNVAASQFGPNSEPPCVAPPSGDQPLATAIATLVTDHGGTADTTELEMAVQAIPLALQEALARVVLGVDQANVAYLSLLAPFSASERTTIAGLGSLLFHSSLKGPALGKDSVKDLLAKRLDVHAIAEGAVRLAFAIESADLVRFAGAKGFAVDLPTPIGRIVVRDSANDSYEDDAKNPILLLVDTGGDDTYRFPAGAVDGASDLASPRHVGVVIDLAGKDTYAYEAVPAAGDEKRLPSDGKGRYAADGWPGGGVDGPISLSETPRQGGARMGYGMLFDLGPESDQYRSLRMSQGFGVAGVGVLYDAGGDDLYEGEAGVQGGAVFGVGLLLDQKGNDSYRTYTYSEGFGFTRGVGMLYDAEGSDQYLADPGDPHRGGDPIYFSPQVPCTLPTAPAGQAPTPVEQRVNCANSSFTQGAAFGRRAPCANASDDCAFMSGGLGVLRDKAGDDVYTTGVYGQATSYWFGTGLLADGSGNDSYDGVYYAIGAGAHFGLSVFLEEGGDDRYEAREGTSIGVGHDYTVSWLVDFGGNDYLHGPALSFGTGNANGVGVLVNIGGNDEYHPHREPTLGCGNLSAEVNQNTFRQKVPTTGIFVDVGGTDVYALYEPSSSNLTRADETSWVDTREAPDSGITSEHGAGLDRANGSVSLP